MYERRFDTEPLWWASYDVMDVCDRMLWCYEHREEAISLGKQAAGIVRDRWTWERAGRDGLAVLDSVMEV